MRVALHPLKAPDLVRVLSEAEGSVLHQLKHDFRGYGIELELSARALDEVPLRMCQQCALGNYARTHARLRMRTRARSPDE